VDQLSNLFNWSYDRIKSGTLSGSSSICIKHTGIHTRSGGVWTQQGSKLVDTGATTTLQGSSVSLSGDGNTAIVGGYADNSVAGAAWVYTRSNGVWTQQGSKIVGTGTVGTEVQQGLSVAISGDANTALVGGLGDNSSTGAAWVFVQPGSSHHSNLLRLFDLFGRPGSRSSVRRVGHGSCGHC
jgi:hypothetical protein